MLEEPGNRGVTGSIQEYRLSTCATQRIVVVLRLCVIVYFSHGAG
jgi:hypothetical protein